MQKTSEEIYFYELETGNKDINHTIMEIVTTIYYQLKKDWIFKKKLLEHIN